MTITNDGVSTLIACEGAAGKVEPKYLATLARVGRWRITGTTLTLSTRTGRRLLVYRASVGRAGAPRLVGRHQRLHRRRDLVTGARQRARRRIRRRHRVRATAAATRSPVRSTVSGTDAIELGPFASTLRACADAAVGTQEQQYLAALGLAKTYQVTGNQLTLFRDGGTIAVTANAPPSDVPASKLADTRRLDASLLGQRWSKATLMAPESSWVASTRTRRATTRRAGTCG